MLRYQSSTSSDQLVGNMQRKWNLFWYRQSVSIVQATPEFRQGFFSPSTLSGSVSLNQPLKGKNVKLKSSEENKYICVLFT